IILFIIPIIYTFSRSSWSALIPMGMVFFFYVRKTNKIVIATLLLLFVLAAPRILPEKVMNRISGSVMEKEFLDKSVSKKYRGKFQTVGDVALDQSTTDRIRSWNNIMKDFKSHPIFGYGVTGYGFIDGQYFRTLIEIGLLGLFSLLYLFYSIFKLVKLNLESVNSPFLKGVSLGLLAGSCALFAHSATANTFIIVRIMEPFWFLMAIVIMSYGIEKSEEQENGRQCN
ncbi:MAG: O-antigen ligase family protein, partial [Pseudomonadota bacterium]